MAKRTTAGKAIGSVISVLAILLLLAGIAAGIAFLLRDPSGEVLGVSYNGQTLQSGQSVGALPSDSELTVYALDYDVRVTAYSTDDNDFSFTIGEEICQWSEYAGADFTSGFDLERANGALRISYGGFEDIIQKRSGLSLSVSAGTVPYDQDLFCLTLGGENGTEILFGLTAVVQSVTILPDNIVL